MGLDMYLYRRRYVKAWDHQKPEERPEVCLKIGEVVVPPIHPFYIEEEIGYWRKANQVHGWFVNHCANGVDQCQQILLEREQLSTLLETCKKVVSASKLVPGSVYAGTEYSGGTRKVLQEVGKVIKDPTVAKELLPVTAGFFFGSYGADGENPYDQYYLQDLQDTIKILQPLLNEAVDYTVTYYYQASW